MPDYSLLDRTLHRVALGGLARVFHDMERGSYLKNAPDDAGQHVFVTGLARAGTTILMREIHGTGAFGSLTYADMPFVLAPNTWRRLAGKKDAGQKAERAHGDGIEVDVDSPEALEEPFWRVKCGADYLKPDALVPHTPDAEVMDEYADFIRLILLHTGRDRYLCKNNNNILRLGALADRFSKGLFLVPIREPLQHALSLLRQHQRFVETDAFTAKYMQWLAHHEFGADQRPFVFGSRPTGAPDSLDYWLSMWVAAYRHLQGIAAGRDNVLFVPFEALTGEPGVWEAVAERVGISGATAQELKVIAPRDPGAHDASLGADATALYGEIASSARVALGVAGG